VVTVVGNDTLAYRGRKVTAPFIFSSTLDVFELTLRRGCFTAGTHCTWRQRWSPEL